MDGTQPARERFNDMMKVIFSAQERDITCDECFMHIDVYVDKLRAGEEPERVLPEVRSHLEQCGCCREEFEALITILEAETGDDSPSPDAD